ncbi:N-terminal Xaa-Pro-Lys N-methyltransferase 1 isoform X3 [Cimex lectularius]|uniref:Alpha N-terminal protein methyltransferase 1 n=1 Tax=Cimex lectularius TaxID=79782 RepID=A0A8I6SMD0_CIMLE|nr:N-terminal Xaa-Pro-Lys N-methyltransferase 1 isoform X3 [Cimex lectularius]XP_024084309.1 N-terminal Xaa-Pro-Lys N-methyltransferase 1 isoform X3 [Cimex lectularius]XP_024084310.1 N-terminal Xaa-Pro-Lys N-methyltransferase 1 isoform X3 [Cimex lectularius]
MGTHSFYEQAKKYWKMVAPTIDGVLGGFGYVSDVDIKGSQNFLDMIFGQKNPPKKGRALDCGAGIGRVTKEILIKLFNKVDLIDQNENFIIKARENLGGSDELGLLYIGGLQNFKMEFKYDLIWCQWVLAHLTDKDLICFLKNCKNSLNKNGVIVIKENVSPKHTELDQTDSSITRPLVKFLSLFKKAGLEPFSLETQTGFPEKVYTVKLIALRPK